VRLDRIGPETFERAVRIYLEEAWGTERVEERWPTDRLEGASPDEIVGHFEDESRRRGAEGLRRYVLRLGNPAYPHMKLVFQEVLIPGEFFFAVDTHDDMELKPDLPGFSEWLELKEGNREIKARIEGRWREDPGVPTSADLKAMFRPGADDGGGRRILVVDDEEEIADVVAVLLAREGYSVQKAYDGEQALEAVEEFRPELLVCDYQMPGLDGVEVCRELRRREGTRDIRVLLSTASMVDLSVFGPLANGFLLKPYNRAILVGFVRRLLPPEPDAS
jgi:CheY-like chemotaxis protein